MAKYDYDKAHLKGLGVGAFLGEVKLREQHIEAADDSPSPSIFNSNVLATKLHPHIQFGVIKKVIEHVDAKEFVFAGNKEKGTNGMAYFRAGQYVSIIIVSDDFVTCRPYTICSGPKSAAGEDGTYSILIKKTEGGKASEYILNNWKVGSEVIMSGPLGHYYYHELRDAKHVIALAGGSGITPFFSMASAIADGVEDFNLTILYGSRTSSNILLKDELAEVEKRSNGRVKVVHVLSDEEAAGYEHGFINADLIKKYADQSDYSVFVCGPKAMYDFAEKEIEKLKLPRRRVRFEVPGETLDVNKLEAFPKDNKDKTFKATVHVRDEVKEVDVPGDVTLMRAMEDAGIVVPSDCRSGQCGWCRSRLIKGDVYFENANRRMADAKFGWIHPCCSYATSDVEIEVFPHV